MKLTTKLLTVALFTISICPTKTVCMLARLGRATMRMTLRTKVRRNASLWQGLKIGGSVLTDKSDPDGTIDHSSINYVAEQIGAVLDENPLSLVITTGAGASAHKLVNKHKDNLSEDVIHEVREKTYGVARLLVDAINEKSTSQTAVLFNTKFTKTENSEIIKCIGKTYDDELYDMKNLISLRGKGIIPVLNANITLNKKGEPEILSADTLLFYWATCCNFTPIFVSRTGGIYDENGNIISILDVEKAQQLFADNGNAMPITIEDEAGEPIMLHMGTSSFKDDVSGGPRKRVQRFSDSLLQKMYIVSEESCKDSLTIGSPIDFFKKNIKGTMIVKADGWAGCYGKHNEQ